jgi:membrane-associated phospholipid phosphatase
VDVYKCQKGFGCPSGHTIWCVAIPAAISLDIRHSNPTSKLMPIVAFAITTVCAITEAWTRMILGVHSMDQVIFSIFIALWIALTFEYCIRKELMEHVLHLNQHKDEVAG